MEYKRLIECAYYSDMRTNSISFDNYISTENMLPNKGGVTTAVSLPDTKSASKYEVNDILLSNIRPYFRKIWLADKEGSCSNDVLVIKSKDGFMPQFLYYVLSDNNFFNYDTVTSKGTKMPRGTPRAIMKYLVPNYEMDEQKSIVNVLSQYDSLIESNNKRIKILEQMAENLYREWFVRFRFPGHETAEFEKGIPKCWEIKKCSSIATVKAGGDRPDAFSEIATEDYPIPIYSNGIENDGLYGYTNKPVITENSITISARGTVGFVCYRRTPYVPIVRLISIIPQPETVSSLYLYYYLQKDSVVWNGTSQQQITIPMVSRKRILVPPFSLINQFEHFQKPIWSEIDTIKDENQNLIKQRDLLLPRLMSGKMEV